MFLMIVDSLLLKNGYNFLNTFVFAIIIYVVFLLLFRFFNKRTDINFSFIRTIIPFLLFGACLRIFEQEGFIKNNIVSFFLRVPGLLIFLFFFYMFLFLIAIKINPKKHKIYLEICGYFLLFSLLLFVFIKIKDFFSFFIIIFLTFFLSFIIFLIFKKIFSEKTNKLTLLSQMLDVVATTYGIIFLKDYLTEVHVLSSLIISISPFLFLIIKSAIVIFLLYFIDTQIIKTNLKTYLKALIIIHGLLIGFRTLLTISLL